MERPGTARRLDSSTAVLVVVGSILLLPFLAAAETPGAHVVDFAWDAPVECPSERSIQSGISELTTTSASSQRWHARARAEHTPEGPWRLHLSTEVDGEKAERDFSAASCSELAATLIVVLAIAVDPTQNGAPAPVAGPTAPPNPPAPTPLPDAPARSVALRPSRDRFSSSFALSAGASGSVGVLASPAFGGGAGLAWLHEKTRVELFGVWFPPSHIAGPAPGTGGAFSLLAAALTGCFSPVQGRVELGVCVGAEGGELHAQGTGSLVQPFSKSSPWVAASVGGLLVLPLTPAVALRATCDVVVPLVRDQFVITGVDDVHTAAPVSGQATLGVELRFP